MGIELDATASIGVAIGSKLDDIHKALNKEEPRPLFIPRSGSNAASGGGPGVIVIGRPPAGRLWNILTVTLTGVDDHTVLANAVGVLYVDADPQNLSLSTARITGMVVPDWRSITKGTIWAHSTGEVCLNVTGNAGGSLVNATVSVAEWKESEVSRIYLR